MLCRILFLALSALAVMQYTTAFPVQQGRAPLTTKYTGEYLQLLTRTIENGRKVLVNVKEELSIKHGQGDELKELGTRADKILSAIKYVSRMSDDDFYKIPLEAEVFLEIMRLTELVKAKPEAGKVLINNSLDVLCELYMLDVTDFVNNFTEDLQSYINGLSQHQRQNQSALINWFNNYKQHGDVFEKVQEFEEFYKNFSYV